MTKLERLLRREGLFIGAHRGYSERYPENTLLAVQEGIALPRTRVQMAGEGKA